MSKNKDDTVSISHNCRSNFPLTKCDCSPKTYLSDTISCPNKTFSPYNIKYNCILYDTLGCKEVSQTDVYIQTSRINEIEGTKIWDNFVNPINNKTIYSISKENEEFQISIYDVSGKLIYQNKLLRELNIGKILLNSGIYLARIIKNNQVQYSVKLEKI